MPTPDEGSRRTLRLPQDADAFVRAQARMNFTSANAEIVRSVRERMQRDQQEATAGQSLPAHPAAATDDTVLSDDPATR